MNNEITLANQIKNLMAKGTRFVSLTYTSKNTGEVARHTLLLGASYEKILSVDHTKVLMDGFRDTTELQAQARREVLASLYKSIQAAKNGTVSEDYTRKNEERIQLGKGVFLVSSGLQITGYSIAKKVLQAGVYKHVNSKPLTLAKQAIERDLKRSKIRNFCLSNVSAARIEGKTLILD
jgi:hypothetical protein